MLYKNHYMLAYLQNYHFFLYRTNQLNNQKQFETRVCRPYFWAVMDLHGWKWYGL